MKHNLHKSPRRSAAALTSALVLALACPAIGTCETLPESELKVLNRFIPGYEHLADHSLPQPSKSLSLLSVRLQALLSTIDGDWSVCVLDLSTGDELILNDHSMPSASEMKLFILGAAYDAVSKGEIERTSELVALLSSMIRVSSNGDANRIIKILGHDDLAAGMRRVNEYIQEYGFSDETHAYNGFQDASMVLDSKHVNSSSAKDTARLLAMIYHRTFSTRRDCNEAEEWMLGQETRYKIPAAIPSGVSVGNKTGETDDTENDAAIIYSPAGDYILSVFSHGWSSKNAAQSKIKELSAEVYRYFNSEDYADSASPLPPVLIQQPETEEPDSEGNNTGEGSLEEASSSGTENSSKETEFNALIVDNTETSTEEADTEKARTGKNAPAFESVTEGLEDLSEGPLTEADDSLLTEKEIADEAEAEAELPAETLITSDDEAKDKTSQKSTENSKQRDTKRSDSKQSESETDMANGSNSVPVWVVPETGRVIHINTRH